MPETLESPWSSPIESVAESLETDLERGLGEGEARARRNRVGRNVIHSVERRNAIAILADQFKSLVIVLLAVAAGVSFAFGQNVEGFAILAVILITVAIGFFTELSAVRSMEALKELGGVRATVLRDGAVEAVGAEDLVPGDVVRIVGGDLVPADIRVTESASLQLDESPLTGESVPVQKQTQPVDEGVPLAERRSMLYKGTTARSGSGHGIVVRTGMDTELGRISALVESAEDEQTPLEKRLNALANRLIWVTIAIAVVNAIAGIVSGRELILMIETSLALAVAAIPEGLPIVATIALARGMWRMARRNALVSRLSAVETLGATNVICTDKTGTVTENRMTVTRVDLADRTGGFVERGVEAASGDETRGGLGDVVGEAIRVGMLCSNASINDERNQRIGDPLEVAILAAGRERGMSRPELLKDYKEVREVAFDPEVKMMATYHRNPEGGVFVAVKGAPEAVMHASSHIRADGESVELDETGRDAIVRRNAELAGEGLRLIAVARKQVQSEEAEPYENLEFLGILGLLDPPRGDVEKAIGLCRHAGIRVIMVTGDQHLTAVHVARAVGIVDDVETGAVHGRRLADASTADETTRQELVRATVFSQVSPKQKLDLIQLHQDTGSVVAMTGDGVNDAPALKKADIGVAMGQRGTEVARESADMVLQDDAFSTITAAIQQGRVIFANIRKFVVYLLSGNISQIMTVGVASVLVLPLPILPLQILFLNLVNDVFPAFALGVGQGSRDVMERPARDPGEPVLTGAHWGWMVGYAALIAAAVMASLTIATRYLGLPGDEAVTISFLTLAFARLWHVFNMRRGTEGMLRNEITRNPYVWGAIALCVLLLGLTPYLPGLSNVLSVNPPGLSGWAVILPASLLPTVIGQLVLAVLGPRRRTPDL